MKFHLIIPASGAGKRFGGKVPKQFIKLFKGGHEALYYVLKKFQPFKDISDIIISTNPDWFNNVKSIIRKGSFDKVRMIVEGGIERQDSVYNALAVLECDNNDTIIIHDAVRPFITKSKLKEMMELSSKNNCLIPGIKINDTIKQTGKGCFVLKTIPRNNMWRVQTPQFFKYGVLMKAFEYSFKKKFTATDEAMLCEAAGYKVKITEGELTNIKITTKDDLKIVDFKKLLENNNRL